MRRFAPGCRTRIEHAQALTHTFVQQTGCGILGRRILYRTLTLFKPRYLVHSACLGQHQAVLAHWVCVNALRQPTLLQLRACGFFHIHAQGHGGGLVVDLQDALPMMGVILLQTFHPPHGMVPNGLHIVVGGLDQPFTFAQKTTQACIQKMGLCMQALGFFRHLNRLVHQGVGFIRRIFIAPCQGQRRA